MDQLTNSIRRQNWVRIIHECHNRPSHMIAKQWMKENGISEKSYYYWQRKFRAEAAERMDLSLPIAQSTPEVTFMELPMTTQGTSPIAANTAIIKVGNAEIEISEDLSDEFLMRIVKAVRYVS